MSVKIKKMRENKKVGGAIGQLRLENFNSHFGGNREEHTKEKIPKVLTKYSYICHNFLLTFSLITGNLTDNQK